MAATGPRATAYGGETTPNAIGRGTTETIRTAEGVTTTGAREVNTRKL